ncbi:MAG TPA: sigma-54 dependent transcriptional regulator [Kofleriaceae bacterium]|jgi:two-component system response regulator GlrR|nr:sigma-54 dependent transcriptional regulator [Kofleriaceae bacterium]
MPPRILVVDKSPVTRDIVADMLHELAAEVGWVVREHAAEKLRGAIANGQPYDVVLLEADGPPAPSAIRELVTAGGGVRVVLAAIGPDGPAFATRSGAADVVAKPFNAAELAFRIGRAALPAEARADMRRPRKSDVLIGTGPWIKELYDRIAMVAATDVTVAIFGESGTGKELVARTIHNSSPRHDAPFVVVNCAAIPEQLLEDELFGHVRGAFTDASRDREGLLSAAHMGTLFLDEIGELPLPLQAKLLRVLQSHEFRRIGDDQDRRVDVRVITATNRDLDQLVARGSFRQDLYYRINVFPMHLPPLRARPEDIALLVHHFVHKYRGRLGKPIDGMSPGALARFATYDFPGNVRELENKVHQAMVVAAGPIIEEDDVALPVRVPTQHVDLGRPFRELKQEAIDTFERGYLTELLRVHGGNLAKAARAAGMDRKNLWALVERHGLDRAQFKKP